MRTGGIRGRTRCMRCVGLYARWARGTIVLIVSPNGMGYWRMFGVGVASARLCGMWVNFLLFECGLGRGGGNCWLMNYCQEWWVLKSVDMLRENSRGFLIFNPNTFAQEEIEVLLPSSSSLVSRFRPVVPIPYPNLLTRFPLPLSQTGPRDLYACHKKHRTAFPCRTWLFLPNIPWEGKCTYA